MRLVAFGLLAATLFGAGCALQPGDPGEAVGTSTELGTTPTPKIRVATTPQGASSSSPNLPNPEPSPWVPVDPMDPNAAGDNQNPEPSPWNQGLPSEQGGNAGGNPGGNTGAGSGSEGTTGSRPVHLVGHWDARRGDLH